MSSERGSFVEFVGFMIAWLFIFFIFATLLRLIWKVLVWIWS